MAHRHPRPTPSALLMMVALMAVPVAARSAPRGDPLERGFMSPPDSAKARIWWHWMKGNITKEGITLDLESIKRVGLGGVQIFDVDYGTPVTVEHPVKCLTPEWLEMLRFAAAECSRLGLEMTIHGSPGWSESGGPWVKPAQAMQKYVFSEEHVTGPRAFAAKLPAPPSAFGPFQSFTRKKELSYYQDTALVAFRTPAGAAPRFADLSPRITSNAKGFEARLLVDGDLNTQVSLAAPGPKEPPFVQIELSSPYTASALSLWTRNEPAGSSTREGGSAIAELQASDDGRTFRPVMSIPARGGWERQMTHAFAPTTARIFRVVFAPPAPDKPVVLGEMALESGARVHRWQDKAGFALVGDYSALTVPALASARSEATKVRDVVDLTAQVGADGVLSWQVPPGNWTILRIGHSPTGSHNGPAPPEATGLECDKLSREAVESYFDGFMNPIAGALGPLVGKTLRYVLLDSWEAGLQNWTPSFLEQFRARRGYDPRPYLPTLAGYQVENAETSDRFLWDVRRTIADLVADNHYGVFRERLGRLGMGLYSEAVGIGLPMMADQLQTRGRTDIPMGEFWLGKGTNASGAPTSDCKEAASAGHIYGKTVIAAESFTASPDIPSWGRTPYAMKAIGDQHLAAGINRFVLHEYAHQPFRDRRPGFTLGPYGTQFGRTVTWWEQGAAWLGYVSRSQFLLQQGLFVGDVLYFYGEGAPATVPSRNKLSPSLPEGFDYDFINAEALLGRGSVSDGRVVLPDGVSYRVLVLPTGGEMGVAVLRKVRDLVEGGVTVVGPKPTRAPGLGGYPQADSEVKRMADELWGECADGCERRFGRGKVVWKRPLDRVLADDGIVPDFAVTSPRRDARFVYLHRRTKEADIYFVANQNQRAEDAEVTFRIAGRQPELWYPDTGRIETAALHRSDGARTTLPLRFDPAGSLFVVFRRPSTTGEGVVAVARDGQVVLPAPGEPEGEPAVLVRSAGARPPVIEVLASGSYDVRMTSGKVWRAQVSGVAVPQVVAGPWEVRFPPGLGAPAKIALEELASWTEHADDGVKHFSGTATYAITVRIPAVALASHRLTLDLGQVSEFAEVSLNGKRLGTLWKPPFRVDVTGAAKAGDNRLEVRVTNLWPNRIIGDVGLPEEKRFTWTSHNPYKKDSPLLTSGLLGPVRLVPAKVVAAR